MNLIAPNLKQIERQYEELTRIGIALSSTLEVDSLLELILTKAREITSADAGSLFLVESSLLNDPLPKEIQKYLRFKLVQNDSQTVHFSEFTLPINDNSIAGYSALHGETIAFADVYSISEDSPYHFNSSYDKEAGYKTRSLLSVPMKTIRGEVIGVMQLINCKRDWSARLSSNLDFDRQVGPFDERSIQLASSLASQAAVALENSQLYQNIQNLFEQFVQAAARAIEQRDPGTFGHSARVATMAVALAQAVDQENSGAYAGVHFTDTQLKELRYATLLHDFGKIAVREDVLSKSKRLFPFQVDILRQRFEYARQQIELHRTQRRLNVLLKAEDDSHNVDHIDAASDREQAELDDDLRFILELNEATVVHPAAQRSLEDIARKSYIDGSGNKTPLLTPDELSSLSIPRGSLTEKERREIESHVMHSVRFLTQIPWAREFTNIPGIVEAHHEKLNGRGYPHGIRGDRISLQTKIMTVCDIFDALSSADRPYKKAVSVDHALKILRVSADKDEIDAELLRIFVEARVFECKPPLPCL